MPYGSDSNSSSPTKPANPPSKPNKKASRFSSLMKEADKQSKIQSRSSRWPKASELKAATHKWSDYEGSPSADSAVADNGAVGQRSKRAPPVDNSYDLADWAGNMAPAPVDWDCRPAFKNNQSVEHIDKWLETAQIQLKNISLTIDLTEINEEPNSYSFANDHQKMIGDIVPRYWIPKRLEENLAPQDFWQQYPNIPPKPMDGDTLQGVKPWWEQYPSPTANFHLPITHPIIKGIDPSEENEKERTARQRDAGSHAAAKNKMNTLKQKAQQAKKAAFNPGPSFAPAAPQPALNLTVRAAHAADIQQITSIINNYISTSITTPETSPLSTQHLQHRLTDINAARLPFLVAVRNSRNPKPKKSVSFGDSTANTILGVAYADDYNAMTGMYRFTSELELYVHPSHLHAGVGTCLMDAMLSLLDPDFISRGGYDGGEEVRLGAQRCVSRVVLNLPRVGNGEEWLEKWLERCGFRRRGLLEGVGVKLGRSVDLGIWMRETGSAVDPKNPPIAA